MSIAEKVQQIVDELYPGGATSLVVGDATTRVPLIAARLVSSTRSFTAGQKVLVYDGYWGMNERVKVAARYRRKFRWVLGVCPIAKLVDGRPVIEHAPAVLRALHGVSISVGMFLPMARGNSSIAVREG